MPIKRFAWTDHAALRREQRHLDQSAVEQAIEDGHDQRRPNDGRADWLIGGKTAEGISFEAIYDHPHGDDHEAVRIVSVWRLES